MGRCAAGQSTSRLPRAPLRGECQRSIPPTRLEKAWILALTPRGRLGAEVAEGEGPTVRGGHRS